MTNRLLLVSGGRFLPGFGSARLNGLGRLPDRLARHWGLLDRGSWSFLPLACQLEMPKNLPGQVLGRIGWRVWLGVACRMWHLQWPRSSLWIMAARSQWFWTSDRHGWIGRRSRRLGRAFLRGRRILLGSGIQATAGSSRIKRSGWCWRAATMPTFYGYPETVGLPPSLFSCSRSLRRRHLNGSPGLLDQQIME